MITISKESLTRTISVGLGSEQCYQARGNTIARIDDDALAARLADAAEAQARFDAGRAEPSFDPKSEEHQALACLRDFVAGPGLSQIDADAKAAVALLIKKAGMR
jgi:hypothetical protein